MPKQKPAPSAPAPSVVTPLANALDKNETIQEVVEKSADELLVINTVLRQALPEHIQTGEVAQALRKTEEMEGKIQESADDLAHVNQLLEQEIQERAEMERELAAAKAALARAEAQSPKP